MYNMPVGGVATGFGGAAAVAAPFAGVNVVWVLLALFALTAAGMSIARVLPRR